MRVADVMQSEVLSTFREEGLADAAQRMRDQDVGALVVLDDDDRMTGVVTERDILRAVAEALAARVTPVSGRWLPTHWRSRLTPRTRPVSWSRGDVRHLPVVRH